MTKPKPIRSKDNKHLAGSKGIGKEDIPTANPLKNPPKEGIFKRFRKNRADKKSLRIIEQRKLEENKIEYSPNLTLELDGRNRPYHQRFSNFNNEILDATEKLFISRPSLLNLEEKNKIFCNWLEDVSKSYNMETPTLLWSDDIEVNAEFGCYKYKEHRIVLNPEHPSIMTLIHEFRHSLQAKGKSDAVNIPLTHLEIDARAWSHSLFYKVRPILFDKLVLEGKILHQINVS